MLVIVALLTGLPGQLLRGAVGCLVVGGALLGPAIVVGYAVRTAERDDVARGL